MSSDDEVAFDDIFDAPAYRAAQTTFAAPAHALQPRGLTAYRAAAAPPAQGLPGSLTNAGPRVNATRAAPRGPSTLTFNFAG